MKIEWIRIIGYGKEFNHREINPLYFED